MVSIGDEVLDGYKATASWYKEGTRYIDDIIEFYRERAAIEREAASKLGSLSSKYFSKKAAVSAAVSVGEYPQVTPGSLENSSLNTWKAILHETEVIAGDRKKFSDEMIVQVADQLGSVKSRFEELGEYFSNSHDKLGRYRDESYGQCKKARGRYHESCSSMESARSKSKKVEQREQDMYNHKNEYIIQINMANRMKNKYYHEDIPELLDTMQEANEARVAQLNRVFKLAGQQEQAYLQRCIDAHGRALEVVKTNVPTKDTEMFVQHNVHQWSDPPDTVFEPSPIWHDSDDMAFNGDNAIKTVRAMLGQAGTSVGPATESSEAAMSAYEDAKDRASHVDFGDMNVTQVAPLLRGRASALQEVSKVEDKRLKFEVEIDTIQQASIAAGVDMSQVPVTRIKTHRTLFGKKKEVVEVGSSSKGSESSTGTHLGLKSLLQRTQRALGTRNGPIVHVLYDFTAGGPGECSVHAGDTLSLSQADDGSGWIKVEGGLVPASYVEIEGASLPAAAPPPPPTRGSRTMTALYPYEAQDSTQLSIQPGDQITIVQADSGTGWTTGSLHGNQGFFPTAYAQ